MGIIIDIIKAALICAVLIAVIFVAPFIGLILLILAIFGIVFSCVRQDADKEG